VLLPSAFLIALGKVICPLEVIVAVTDIKFSLHFDIGLPDPKVIQYETRVNTAAVITKQIPEKG
jgi:hypothetical protein